MRAFLPCVRRIESTISRMTAREQRNFDARLLPGPEAPGRPGTLRYTMSQIPLFARAGDTALVDDERGRITYTPDLVTKAAATAWFAELRESVSWSTQRRRMYDREVAVPRRLARFPLSPSRAVAPLA